MAEIKSSNIMLSRRQYSKFVESDPRLAPAHIAVQFKGFTSRILRQEFPFLKSRLPSLWSRSYYIGSVVHVSEATVRKYIENQKGR